MIEDHVLLGRIRARLEVAVQHSDHEMAQAELASFDRVIARAALGPCVATWPPHTAALRAIRRPILYMAHPVAGDVSDNIARALRWLLWLRRRYTRPAIIAPYIANILAGEDDADPAQRARGLEDNCELVAAISVWRAGSGVILVGGRLSDGMRIEGNATLGLGQPVYDMLELGREPPDDGVQIPDLAYFARGALPPKPAVAVP